MIYIAGTFVMEGGTCRAHRDMLATINVVIVVVVQMPGEESVVPVLQQPLDRLETVRGVFPGRLVQKQKRPTCFGTFT